MGPRAADAKVLPEGRELGMVAGQWSEVCLDRWPGHAGSPGMMGLQGIKVTQGLQGIKQGVVRLLGCSLQAEGGSRHLRRRRFRDRARTDVHSWEAFGGRAEVLSPGKPSLYGRL